MKVKYEGKRLNLSVLGIGAFPIGEVVKIKDEDWNRIKSIEGMKQVALTTTFKSISPKSRKKFGGEK